MTRACLKNLLLRDTGSPLRGARYFIFTVILFAVVGTLIYSGVLRGEFHYDDFNSIVANSAVRDPFNIAAIWHYWPTRFITYFSLALNYRLGHWDTYGYHLGNLAIHVAASLEVWLLALVTLSAPGLREIAGVTVRRYAALVSGILFLVHPLQTGAVSYIVQRATILGAFFYLGSLTAYARARLFSVERGWTRSGVAAYALSLVLGVAAMYAKEFTVSLPLAVLLYDYCFFNTGRWFSWRRAAIFTAVALLVPLTMAGTRSVDFLAMKRTAEEGAILSPWYYFLTQLRVMMTYLRLTFLPLRQHFDYFYPASYSFFEFPVLASAAGLAGLIILAFRLHRRYRVFTFGILWFFITLLPESSFIPIYDVIFEHRMYLPLAGFAFSAGAVFLYLRPSRRQAYVLLTVLAVFLCVTAAYRRNWYWRSRCALIEDSIQKSPAKVRPRIARIIFCHLAKGDHTAVIDDFIGIISLHFGRDAARVAVIKKTCSGLIAGDPTYYSAYMFVGNTLRSLGKVRTAGLAFDIASDIGKAYRPSRRPCR